MRRIRLAGLLAALIVAAIIHLPGGERFSQPVYDAWQRLSPRDLSNTDVRIVWIDDQSVSQIHPWPWPRRTLANLVYAIADGGPKVIGLDVILPEPDRYSAAAFAEVTPNLPPALAEQLAAQPDTDQLLGQTIGTAPVVLGRVAIDADRASDAPEPANVRAFAEPLPKGVLSWEAVITNIAAIDDVGLGHGLLNGDPDRDGVVRKVPLAARVANFDMPSLSLEMALQMRDEDKVVPVIAGDRLTGMRVGGELIRTSKDGRMTVRLADKLPKGSEMSAFDVLEGSVPPSIFAGKAVIVALNATGTQDQVSTVLSQTGYGATVQANAVDTILNDAELWRPGWAWIVEGLAAVLLVAMAVRLLPRLRGWPAFAITIASFAAVFAFSWAAYAQFNLLIDPVAPVLTAFATGVTMVLMLFAESRRRQRELAERLRTEQLASARSQGELDAARDIQLGMLPPREALAKLDPAVEVDAFVIPAREIGGDFFDAVRIDEHRLCFLVGDVTGKGVPAALFMALSKALTKSVLLRDGSDLAAAVTRLNDEVARDNSEAMFVTMLVALLDTRDGTLALCNAGHENPWLVRASGEVEMLKPEGGPPLSVAPGFSFEASTVEMAPGDALFVISDGITEAQDRSGAFFGSKRLMELLLAAQALPIKATTAALLQNVRAFEGDQDASDDVTVLGFRYTPL